MCRAETEGAEASSLTDMQGLMEVFRDSPLATTTEATRARSRHQQPHARRDGHRGPARLRRAGRNPRGGGRRRYARLTRAIPVRGAADHDPHPAAGRHLLQPVSYTHLTLPTKRIV